VSFISRLFGRREAPPAEPDEELVPVPIPPLGVLLLELEKQKGSPLTEAEVLDARDNCVCMMMRVSDQRGLEEKRGFRDIDPENCWAEWLAFRAEVDAGPSDVPDRA
jgi:hypothetical protein